MTGRYFIFRSVTALKWETEKDGRRTGTIKVQHYKDAAHIEPLGEPEYFRGTVPATDDETPENAYRDAMQIIAEKRNRIEPPEKGLTQQERYVLQ
ncbi:MAG: hypothetical protein IIY54_10635 [Ruminococcus sp.]|nr:hypothetical protein [Ruminococcus sp.]MBQ1310154.1 hypothetical protein [Ruminococcus sp.]